MRNWLIYLLGGVPKEVYKVQAASIQNLLEQLNSSEADAWSLHCQLKDTKSTLHAIRELIDES